jgi:Protein of unknown function (DUF3435)
MYAEDQKKTLEKNLSTTEKRYVLGRIRMQVHVFIQEGGFTANRPDAILKMCYGDLIVSVLRDPEGGPHRILLEFTYEFTKTFLGVKEK